MLCRRSVAIGSLVLLGIVAAITVAQEARDTIYIKQDLWVDQYLAAREIEVHGVVNGDLVAAGQRIMVAGEVTEDVMAAGETVDVKGDVHDDIRAAGRMVSIAGDVGGHVVAAGRSVTIEAESSVRDWAWLVGERVQVSGNVGGDVEGAGRTVIIAGEIGGDANLAADNIRIESGALIRGDLIYRSHKEPEISEEARIEGRLIEEEMPEVRVGPGTGVFLAILSLGALIAAIVIHLLFPHLSRSTSLTFRTQPLASLGLGFAVLAATPLAIFVLFITGVGYLLALGLLGAYLLALLLGMLLAIAAVGALGLHLIGKPDSVSLGLRVLSIILAFVVLGLIEWIPFIGGLVIFIVFLVALGALTLVLYRALPAREAA